MLRLQRAPGDFGVGKGHGGMDPHGHPPGCTFQPISCPFGKNRFGPVWYTIYHQTNLLLKGFLQTPLLINQAMGIWDTYAFNFQQANFYTCLVGI